MIGGGGFVHLIAPCYVCGGVFASNPHRVPSFKNQSICRACIELINRQRQAKGLPEWPIFADSYEAIEAGAL